MLLAIMLGAPVVIAADGASPTASAALTPDCTSPPATAPPVTAFTEPLTVPPKVDRRTSSAVVKLYARSGTHPFHQSLPPTPTFGYSLTTAGNDVYGGPTIEANRKEPVQVTVVNQLGTHPLAGAIDSQVMGTVPTDATAPRGNIHLHGAHTEARYDGLPEATVAKGRSFTYTYGNDQDATGLWYHDHSWGITRLQVAAGLVGQYWLRDEFDTGRANNPLGLPTGAFELPLTIQDRSLGANGALSYPIGPHCGVAGLPMDYPGRWAPESFGDVATVNGKIEPNLDAARGVYRLRLLNASNARFYDLRLVGVDQAGTPTGATAPLFQIGSDGGLLNAPVSLTSLRVAPAERADLLVDFRTLPIGSRWRFVNDALAPYPDGGDAELAQVMQFTVGAGAGSTATVPTRLRGGPDRPRVVPIAVAAGAGPAAALATTAPMLATTAPVLAAGKRRVVALNEIADDLTDPPTITGEPVHVLLDNLSYEDPQTMARRSTKVAAPALNSVEEWDIVNTTGDAHPIHLHLTQFLVLDRQALATDASGETTYLTNGMNCSGIDADPANCAGGTGLPNPEAAGSGPWPAISPAPYLVGSPVAPAANERGWKDTVVAMPGTVTRIVVPFGGTAAGIAAPFVGDAPTAATQRFMGTYVFHCHILEHEDNDMMSPYRVG